MPQGLRFEPITVRPDRVVARTRLTGLLNGRFTHRVTTVTGAAGFGKTTAMALAIENNRLDPVGCDVWLALMPNATVASDNERAGRLFVAALDASGDRSAALGAADELLTTLRSAELEPTTTTLRVVDRLR
jgi:ATP/maltotriose-dependent transcriptional regulator MalT